VVLLKKSCFTDSNRKQAWEYQSLGIPGTVTYFFMIFSHFISRVKMAQKKGKGNKNCRSYLESGFLLGAGMTKRKPRHILRHCSGQEWRESQKENPAINGGAKLFTSD